MSDTIDREQSKSLKEARKKLGRMSSVRIQDVRDVNAAGASCGSQHGSDWKKSRESIQHSDVGSLSNTKSLSCVRGSVRFVGSPEEATLNEVDAAALTAQPLSRTDFPTKPIRTKLISESDAYRSRSISDSPSKQNDSELVPEVRVSDNPPDDMEDIGIALHYFDQDCDTKMRDLFSTEMLVLHNELRDYKKHNTMLDRQIHVLQTQLRRMTENLTIARTLMMKDHINNWDKIVQQLGDHKKKSYMTEGASHSLLAEFTDRVYNSLVLTNKLWNQHRIQCGQREISVPDFPTIFDEEVLHEWDDYNESMNHDLEAIALLDTTEEKMVAEENSKGVDQPTPTIEITNSGILRGASESIGLGRDTVTLSVTCQSEGGVPVPSDATNSEWTANSRMSASAPMSAVRGKVQHVLQRKVKTLMAASRTRRALSQSLTHIQNSANAGRMRGKVDVVDEVAGLLSALERPTCVGMLDHQAMHIVRIQHKVRVFLARRRRIKSELARSWLEADLKSGSGTPSLRTQQLKLFCIENEIADDIVADTLPDTPNTSILRQTRSHLQVRKSANA